MNNEVKILLVEDNEGDIVLTKQALKKANITGPLNVVKDGDEAMKYLMKEGKFENASIPDLILLDINLPKLDGMEVLSKIKNNEIFKAIPVVMLTTSDSEKDIIRSYNNHANCYITKPVDFKGFMEVVQMIKDFWINIVQFPQNSKSVN